MDERNYYRNRSECKPADKKQPEKKSNFGRYMFLQSVTCLTLLALMLVTKLVSQNIYTAVKEAFAGEVDAKAQLEGLFDKCAEYVEELPVFSPLFEKDAPVEIKENEPMIQVGMSIDAKEGGVLPVFGGTVTDGYGLRDDPFTGKRTNHTGVDIGVNIGTCVVACFEGRVKEVSCDERLGNYVILEHQDGLETVYGHLLCPLISEGQFVSEGDRIALSGNSGRSTGPHLHFAVKKDGKFENPFYYLDMQS